MPLNLLKQIKTLPLVKKLLFWGAVLLFVFTITGFFILPPIVKSVLVKKLSEQLNREVTIQKISINPFVLSASIKGFMIKERKGPETFVSFDEVYVNLQSASVFKRGLIIEELRVSKPYLNVVRNADMSYNFSDLIKEEKTRPSAPSKPLRFSLNNIQVINGSADFFDGPKNTKHRIRDTHIQIPFLSNLSYYVNTYVQPSFEAKFNDNPIVIKGRTKPFAGSRETILDLDIKNLDIPYYLAYVPFKLNFKLVSAYLNSSATVSYTEYSDREPTVKLAGNVSLNKIQLSDTKLKPLVNVPVISVKDTLIDLAKKEVVVGEISTENAIINVSRLRDGKLNMEELIPADTGKKEQPAKYEKEQPAKQEKEQPAKKEKEVEERQWILTLKKIALEGYEIRAEDLVPPRPVNITASQIKLIVEDISTAKDSTAKASLSFVLNKKGSVTVNGDLGIDPVLANLNIDAKGLGITPLQPYIEDKVKIILTDGKITAKGNVGLTYSKDKGPKVTYKGMASVTSFAAIDKVNADDFLKWKSLYINGIDLGYNPLYAKIKGIALTDFYSRIIVNQDGSLNVQGLLEKDETKPEGAAGEEPKAPQPVKKEEAPKNFRIDTVTLQAGTINFSDNHIKPSYSANLLEIGGRVSGLSSEANKTADVELRGKLENYAPLEISGKINPLSDDLFVDLKVDFKNMELSPLTPYSGKYLGYTIHKGKLFLSLQYLIVKKKLDSQNNVFLDQFTLGDTVESPDATKLPVRLAIALLKNRKGEIELNLPVTGEIDDPKFSIGGIIIKILVNILVKAATAPFALLGAIFGGGEELSYVDFDYGSFILNAEAEKKLNTLVKALSDRPALKLEIEGHVDTEKDTEGLRQYLFNKKIKTQKLKDMLKQGTEMQVDDIKIEDAEYPKYLKMAYKEEKFPKPRNIIGIAKDLPVPEMEKLMVTHIEVKENELRALASQRSLKVKDYILKSKQVEQERIFLTEPKSLSPEKKDKTKDSRVDFKLK